MAENIKGTIAAGVVAVAGAVGGGDPNQRLESLRLLVETKLLKDDDVRQAVLEYAKAREAKPETIPQVVALATPSLTAPVVADARIFLLAGAPAKQPLFAAYKAQLEAAGFRVLDSKILNHPGRPAHVEVRYFYAQDAAQADALAEFVRFKLADDAAQAKLYQDHRVRPGYIEVWFGK